MAAPIVTEEKLSAEEFEQGRLYVEQTHKAVIGATRCLSEAQWHFKRSPDCWSIAEILNHIVTVQERVLGPMLDHLATAPPPPDGHDRQIVDSVAIHQFPTRLNKFPSPEAVRPSGQSDPSDLLHRLAANRVLALQRLESVGLRQHALESAPLRAISKGAYQYMDGYQWTLATAAHTMRHVKQMLEVMAEPAYPLA